VTKELVISVPTALNLRGTRLDLGRSDLFFPCENGNHDQYILYIYDIYCIYMIYIYDLYIYDIYIYMIYIYDIYIFIYLFRYILIMCEQLIAVVLLVGSSMFASFF